MGEKLVLLFILLMMLVSTADAAPSEGPRINVLISEKPSTILIQWKNPSLDKVNGVVKKYQVHFRIKGDTEWTSVDVQKGEDNHQSLTVTDVKGIPLQPWKTYQVYVSLFNQKFNASSDFEEVLVVGNGPGGAPKNFTATLITEESLVLTWEKVPLEYLPASGSLEGYKVFYQEDKGKQRSYTNDLIKDTRLKIENLKRGTTYRFSIVAVANGKVGPVSEELEVMTLKGPLPRPRIVTLESRSPGSFYFQCQVDPSVLVTRLILKYKEEEFIDSWSRVELGTRRRVTLKNMKSWQQYDVMVQLESEERKSSSQLIPVLVVGEVPGRGPTDIIVKDFNYKFITLQWQPINPRWVYGDIRQYVIKHSLDADKSLVDIVYSNTTKVTVTKLQPGTAYRFQVAGQTKYGVGAYSDYVVGRTKQVKKPAIPMNVHVKNVNPRKVRIRCSVRGDVSMFVVSLNDVKRDEKETVEYHMTAFRKESLHEYSLVVTVKPFTRYLIQLKSCIITVCSDYSAEESVLTMEDLPSEVRNVGVTQMRMGDNPIASWLEPEEVPGVLQRYVLDVTKHDVSLPGYPHNVSNATLSSPLKDLPPYEELMLSLTAVTVGAGPRATFLFKSPQGLPSVPVDLQVILLKDDVISVRWKKPAHANGVLSGYLITYRGTKSYNPSYKTEKSIAVPLNATDKPYRIKKLVPGTYYTVEVAARTALGYGKSDTKSRVTPVQAPPAPPTPLLSNDDDAVTPSTIKVHLQKASQEFGPIDKYQLIIEEHRPEDTTRASRVKRSNLPPDLLGYAQAKRENRRFYICAVIDSMQVPGRFIIGDDVDYNHYRNHPLKPATRYSVHFRATTKRESNTLYGDTSLLALPSTSAVPSRIEDDAPIPTALIVGLAGGIIAIILAVVVFIKCKRSQRKKKEESPYEIRNFKVMATADETEEMLPVPSPEAYGYVNPDHMPVAVAQFPKHVTKLHRNDNAGFKAEYPQLKIGKESPWDVAHLLENKPKNRYANIVAYDHSRVKLSRIHGVAGSDYINASYIDGYRRPNAYVSTQGPLPSTYNDFWRMVWEIKSSSIVMLTNLQEKNKLKCHKYWPDDNDNYGDIRVTFLHTDSFADFTVRTFKLEDMSKERTGPGACQVTQFHFTSWPDHGVPQYPTPLLNFRKKVREFDVPDAGPTVVHCSAGVGRTGAYIAVDSMLERIMQQKNVDIFNFIANMRMRRIAMVQTEDQYIFVYDAILEAIINGDTEIPLGNLRDTIKALDQIDCTSKVSGFETQWKTLNQSNVGVQKSDLVYATQGENVNKNRYSTVLPTEHNRVLLTPIDESEASTYINATYVHSYKQKNAFILTQSPLPRTVFDFWRMVAEHGTTSIVMLNNVDEGDDYAKFWPESGKCEYDMICVECIPNINPDNLDLSWTTSMKPMYRTQPSELVVRCFEIIDKRNSSKTLTVKLFQYNGWTETRVPNTYRPIISLLSHIERWQLQSGRGPVTIMCSDGIGRSATLAGIIFVLEYVKLNQVIDCFQAVKSMRIQRPHAVKYMDQYKYIHHAVQEYLNAFQEHTKL